MTWEHVHGVYRYHRDIFDAIQHGDAEAARASMTRHINFGKEGGLRLIAEQQVRQEREACDNVADDILNGMGF